MNPKSLVKELAYLKENNVATDNLRISDRAHVILPYHIKLDQLQEDAKGENKIGTTIKGIKTFSFNVKCKIAMSAT